MLRTHHCGELTNKNLGETVTLCGWADSWRDHGGVVFIDLRDRWGLTQLVFNPEAGKEIYEQASKVRSEYVIQVTGKVAARPQGTENPKLATGQIEVQVAELEVLNASPTPPLEIGAKVTASEEVRLKYRYLDLRRPTMQKHLHFRYKITKVVRDYLDSLQFIEVETPYLTKSTPEGARDYLVPCRLSPGTFYALPQSPQLFKQILMVAGYDRYFQIVRCFRDEDLRADRQPEHTQIDMEMSFADQGDIMQMVEGLVAKVFKETLGISVTLPLRRIPYDDAMNRYGSDKPDLRFDLSFVDLVDVFKNTQFQVFQSVLHGKGSIKGIRVPGGATFSRKDIDGFTEYVKQFGVKGLAWFKADANGKLESQITKFFSEPELARLQNATQMKAGDILFIVASDWATVCNSLGALRLKLGQQLNLIEKGKYELCWVVDFPLFGWNADEKRYEAMHHPFTSPRLEEIPLLTENPLQVKARAYDLVLNGTEIGGGSIRIHREDLQEQIFSILGINKESARLKFGFLLDALKFGAPPHGGIAIGLDRFAAMLLGVDSIRDVIAFPKTQKGTCQMTDAPSEVDEKQLEELSIRIKKTQK